MEEILHQLFGCVCGQYPAHTWSPGGEALPLCQRCSGLYVGALVAALLHLAQRPAPTPRWLWLNGAFLFFMVPSAAHWIPQNPELRCASGILFGAGLVAFLWLTLPENYFCRSRRKEAQIKIKNQSAPPHVGSYKTFAAGLLAALVLTPLLAENGNAIAAGILVFASIGGALALAVLLLANLFFLLRAFARRNATITA